MTKVETYEELFICTNNGVILLFRDDENNPDMVEYRKCSIAGNGWVIPVILMIGFYRIKRVEISGPINADIVEHCKRKGVKICREK